jgi:hypothetical protein
MALSMNKIVALTQAEDEILKQADAIARKHQLRLEATHLHYRRGCSCGDVRLDVLDVIKIIRHRRYRTQLQEQVQEQEQVQVQVPA